jgi:hypothetical protein
MTSFSALRNEVLAKEQRKQYPLVRMFMSNVKLVACCNATANCGCCFTERLQ